MLDPRSATGSPAGRSAAAAATSATARPSSSPPRRAVPAHVVADGDEPGRRRRARHVGVVLLARPRAVQDHQPGPRLAVRPVEHVGEGEGRMRHASAPIMAAATRAVYPEASSVQDGRLSVGGCDAVELAREFGTPLYVMAEDDLRARAREFRTALETHHGGPGEVIFASKACPVTAVLRVFAEEGLGVDVASGGELHLALKAGFEPERIYLHGNAKAEDELRAAVEAGVGWVVVDNHEDVAKLAARAAGRRPPARAAADPAGRRRRHPRRDPHRPRRVEVRPRPARGARAGAGPARAPRRAGLPLPPRLPAQRPDAVPRRGRRAGRARRPARLQPRRRLRGRLHRRRPAAGDRRVGRRRRRGGARPARARTSGS